ncbi:MAG: hypothetical protein GF383_13390, partial [Candidatus Lokiarchaeota archaeon]|nr:hypothetical protein [Candidatus Lokiarchaeota archaeon]MBD3342191.1 hypothetical protein [Candidatus Lokiarchaeota archaeon]
MRLGNELHKTVTHISPQDLPDFTIPCQNKIIELISKKFLKFYGLSHFVSYIKSFNSNKNFKIFPYMPKDLSTNSYLYDLHSHSEYSDGIGNFKEILTQVSKKKHLNGLAITDHPYKPQSNGSIRYIEERVVERSFKFQKMLNRSKLKGKLPEDFISFPGSCEFLTRLSEDYPNLEIELIGLGLSRQFIQNNRGIKKITRGTAIELIEKIHDDNGLVILPHPFFFMASSQLLNKKLSRYSRPDAIETLNYSTGFLSDDAYFDFFKHFPQPEKVRVLSKIFGYFNWIASLTALPKEISGMREYPLTEKIALVGNSDAHIPSMIGSACSLIKERINNLEDLRKQFKNNDTIPIYNP